jgi:hypothetical protein
VLRESERRLSVEVYLEEGLADAKALLRAMCTRMVSLSGSRSLEFFVPGSCTPTSDWDFYIADIGKLVPMFLLETEAIGYTWLSPLEEVAMRIDEGSGIVSIPENTPSLEFLKQLRKLASERGLELARERDFSMEGRCCVRVTQRNLTLGKVGPEDEYPGNISQVIMGKKRVRGGSIAKINLVITGGNDYTNTKFLQSFHSSCVQSVLTAHAACHMYGKMASERLTYQWPDNMELDRDKAGAAKYVHRGFRVSTYVPPPRGFSLRTGDDEHCTTLLGYNYTGSSPSVVRGYVARIRGISWFERKWGTREIAREFLNDGLHCESMVVDDTGVSHPLYGPGNH